MDSKLKGYERHSGVVSLNFVEQFDESRWFEERPSGAKALSLCAIYGTIRRGGSCPDTKLGIMKLTNIRDRTLG